MSSHLRDHLQAIYDQRGELTPRLVVDLARDPDHPLHNRFEWDDSIAAERYRQQQAGDLIRSVKVTYREAEGDKPAGRINAWQTIPRPEGRTYVPVEEIATNPIESQILIREAERAWRDLQRRYGHLTEFIDMVRNDLNGTAA